jgi:hypothetical protein
VLVVVGLAVPVAALTTALTVLTYLADSPAPVLILAIGTDPTILAASVLAAGVLFLFALATFTVAEDSSTRSIGLLTANGATEHDIVRLTAYQSLIPGSSGVLIGMVAGWLVGLAIAGRSPLTDPSTDNRLWVSLLNLAVPALLAAAAMVAGAWLPARRAARTPAAVALGSRLPPAIPKGPPRPSPATDGSFSDRTRTGWIVSAVALGALAVSSLLFNEPFHRYSLPEQASYLGWIGLVISTLLLLVGVSLVLPSVIATVSRRLLDRSLALAGPGLERARGRTGAMAAAFLILSALTVMAVAGIDSDRGVWVEADGRYLDYHGTAHDKVDEILTRYKIEPRILSEVETYLVPRIEDDNGVRSWWSDRATMLTADLTDALRLDDDDRRAAIEGAVLVNSAAVGYVGDRADSAPITMDDTLTTIGEVERRFIDRGEARGTVLALLVTAEAAQRYGWQPVGSRWIAVFDPPLDGAAHRELHNLRFSADVQVGKPPALPGVSGRSILIVVAAAILVVLGWVGSVMAGTEQRAALATMADLGASSSLRRRILTVQALIVAGVAGTVGSALGTLLFFLVTRGDSSVPTWIIPWDAVVVLVLAVPAAVTLLVWLSAAVQIEGPDQIGGIGGPRGHQHPAQGVVGLESPPATVGVES